MGHPLRVYPPGSVVFVTDRCLDEAYLLLPDDPRIVEIVSLAWRQGLAMFEVDLLALVVMSNHWHALLRSRNDPTAVPSLMQYVKSRVARRVNRLRERHGTFWSKRYSAIDVVDDASVVGRVWYLLHNPVKAGLCADASEWTGLSTLEAHIDVRAACGRLEVPVTPLPHWENLEPHALRIEQTALRGALDDLARSTARERKSKRLPRPDVGLVVSAVTWKDRPERPARSPRPPCFAATREAFAEHRARTRVLRSAYRDASRRYRSGEGDVAFPPFTFLPPLWRVPHRADTAARGALTARQEPT